MAAEKLLQGYARARMLLKNARGQLARSMAHIRIQNPLRLPKGAWIWGGQGGFFSLAPLPRARGADRRMGENLAPKKLRRPHGGAAQTNTAPAAYKGARGESMGAQVRPLQAVSSPMTRHGRGNGAALVAMPHMPTQAGAVARVSATEPYGARGYGQGEQAQQGAARLHSPVQFAQLPVAVLARTAQGGITGKTAHMRNLTALARHAPPRGIAPSTQAQPPLAPSLAKGNGAGIDFAQPKHLSGRAAAAGAGAVRQVTVNPSIVINNTIEQKADVMELMGEIERSLDEMLQACAEGVYQ